MLSHFKILNSFFFSLHGLLLGCFVRLLEHLTIVLARPMFPSLQFETETKLSRMSVRLYQASGLLDVILMRCGRDVTVVKTQFLMVAIILGAVSEKTDVLCFCGSNCRGFEDCF